MNELAVIAGVLAVVAALRSRIERLPLTAPMLYVAAGMVLAPEATGVLDIDLQAGEVDETVALAAELTLAMLLFSDAARIDVMALRRSFDLPARLLVFGLPLTVVMGTVMTSFLLPDLGWAAAALVAAILAPTDAALGQAVVSDRSVPVKIRQTLNVESGLNDGLVVPAVAVLTGLAAGAALDDPSSLAAEAVAEILFGTAVGVGAGFVLARVTAVVIAKGWTDAEGMRLTAFAVALGAFGLAGFVGGNGFIAAFTAGLWFRAFFADADSLLDRDGAGSAGSAHEGGPQDSVGSAGAKATSSADADADEPHDRVDAAIELAEDAGQVGASATFILFGALMVWPALADATPAIVACALLTLTLGRIIPVAIALTGTGLLRPTVLFLGWFGPRGLASMLFGLLLLADGELQGADELFSIISIVVLASVVLHGVSAVPGAGRYARWFRANVGDESRIGHAGDGLGPGDGHRTDGAPADSPSGGAEPMMEAEHMPESRLRWQR